MNLLLQTTISSAALAAGDQAGIRGWAWLVLAFILIILLAIFLIRNASMTMDSPYIEKPAQHSQHETTSHHASETAIEGHAPANLEHQPDERLTVEQPADDLEKIEGIGPKIAVLLNQAGIYTFAQLAGTPVEKLSEILLAAKLRISDPSTWPDQARLAAAGEWEEFERLTAQLKGGRKIG